VIRLDDVNGSQICYETDPGIHISEYYAYCLKLIKNKLLEVHNPINIIFGNLDATFNNSSKILKMDIQYEHTLVKEGGRDVGTKFFSNTPTDDGELYLVRIDRFDYFNSLDVILEYSIPNIVNISESGHFDEFSKKLINIAPLIYTPKFNNENKNNTITLFTPHRCPRRSEFYNNVRAKGIDCTNVDGCFTSLDIMSRYETTKILVNVHQTDHHHTFEELRVLPALSRGVIVISEDVPLKENIPYGEHIVWADYDNLCDTIIDVQNNYEEYYKKIFNNGLTTLLSSLEVSNNRNLDILKNKAAERDD
tara:strand:+ start:5699 stop:6619 length:921 start_codon:yes stop_codon:yes gene_type:complete